MRELAQEVQGHAMRQMQARHPGLSLPPLFQPHHGAMWKCCWLPGSPAVSLHGMMSTGWITEPQRTGKAYRCPNSSQNTGLIGLLGQRSRFVINFLTELSVVVRATCNSAPPPSMEGSKGQLNSSSVAPRRGTWGSLEWTISKACSNSPWISEARALRPGHRE